MNKKKTAKRLLAAAVAISGAYLVILILISCLQKWLKPMQDAPLGVRDTFYFPIDDVVVSAVCFVFMLLISLVLIRRIGRGMKTGGLPAVGIAAFGVLVPFVQKLAAYWEGIRLADGQVSTEASIDYVTSASYVHDLTAWAVPLLFVSCALFAAGCAAALFARENEKR